MASAASADRQKQGMTGVLGWIERSGNKLPDPVFLFFWLIFILIAISIVADLAGLSASHPTEIDPDTGALKVIAAKSLLAPENIARLWVDMPTTFTHFHPLGYVLVVMLGAGVAERAGLFGTAMRAGVRDAPKAVLTPIVVLVGMLGNLAADAAYVVLIPLAGIIFHAAGRNPVAGIAAAFAGVSGGFSANLLPGQLDALLFGITEASVETVFGDFTANIVGNWYFIAAMTFVFLPVIWFVTDKIIEPRLGPWNPAHASNVASDSGAEDQTDRPLTPDEKKGLKLAGLAVLFVIGLWLLFTLGPGTPLIDETASEEARLNPFYKSLVGGFFDNVRPVKRRDWQQVEQAEKDVDEDEEEQARWQHARLIDQHHRAVRIGAEAEACRHDQSQQHSGNRREHKIAPRPGSSHRHHPITWIVEPPLVHRYRLRPAKHRPAHQRERSRNEQRANRINMLDRVQGQAPALARCAIAQQLCHVAVGHFVKDDRDDQTWDQDQRECKSFGHG